MKKCSYCGAQMNDDSLFCTECGKPIPQGSVCPHCGASVNDGDSFCQSCGKSINEPQSESSSYEPTINEEDKNNGFKKYLPYIIGAFVLLMIIGYCSSNETSNNNNDAQVADSINVGVDNDNSEQEIQAKKDFLEKFYNEKNGREQDDEYAYIKKNVTANGLQNLKDLYDFECDGECLATWVFDYDSGSEIGDQKSRTITPQDENTFLVENKYEYANYSVLLTVVKEDGVYKIDKIEQKESSYFPQEQDEAENYDWLQGHWVYDVDVSTNKSYRIHVVIEGNRIIQYKNSRSESTNPTFTIEDGAIHAQYYTDMETTYKIDPIKQSIDLGDGWRWMYKLGSDEEIRHRVGFETENTFFIKIANQLFRNREGNEIRFDENRKVYFNDVYAGTLSIVKLEEDKAIVKYSGGECEEGKLEIRTNYMTSNWLMVTKVPFDAFYDQVH
jgi:hypothetical protein